MSFDCKVGDTVFIDDDGGGHRYVVLTNPNRDDCVVIVNFTSATGRINDGKMFTSSDNKRLFENPTVVPYKRAKIYPCNSLRAEVNRRDVVSDYKLCPPSIMAQIIKDAFKSQYTEGDVIEELKTQYPKEYNLYYEDPED
jgi:hypothetical protein